jgi:glutamyl-tRNA synthetase
VAWLFARSSGGSFLVRMEDLDPVTSSREKAGQQLDDLTALGITWDGEVVFQSDRFALYDAAIDTLVQAGLTYPCFCSRREVAEAASAPHGANPAGRYPGTCRSMTLDECDARRRAGRRSALRLRAPGAPVMFVDRIVGRVEAVPDDIVLRRNDGMPAYNLAVVVDDDAQGVEEVVRGDDLVSSTPGQIALGSLLGLRPVSYAHIPLVLGPTRQRLAKRDGAVTLAQLRERGISAAEVLSDLAGSLGLCRPGAVVTTDALVERFRPAALPHEPWIHTPRPDRMT